MKRCPTCQKTYADTMKFCQTDGTPLIEDKPSAPPDPYKTVVGSLKNDDVLQIPDNYDPMKTMVSAPKTDVPKPNAPEPAEQKKESQVKDSAENSAKSDFGSPFSPPKPADSSLNPPSFGDLSSSVSSGNTKPRSFDETFSSIEPPVFGSTKGNTAPFDKPSDAPFGKSSKDDAPPTAFGGTPFETPKSSPPPPYKEPESFNPGNQSPFGQQASDPWGTPQTPFGQQSNDPFGTPQFGGQQDWTPPPVPVSGWQDQGLGANTPFQPPMGTGGQNQTLAIVSLVTGILGLCCGISGIVALITGYMAKNNADTNPAEYGGRGMALAGMILGGISILFMVVGLLINLLGLLR